MAVVLQQDPCFVRSWSGENTILSIYHNKLRNERCDDGTGFSVEYVHDTKIKENDYYEIKIGDLGTHVTGGLYQRNIMAIGIGIDEKHFTHGITIDSKMEINTHEGELCRKDRHLGCGDIIRLEAKQGEIDIYLNDIERKNDECNKLCTLKVDSSDEIYHLFIGMNEQFQRVALICNKTFASLYESDEKKLTKKKMRVLVATINEGSPVYGEGVARGGQHLLNDGMLVRRLRAEGVTVINYCPGASSYVYDAKAGGDYDLPDMLPEGLHRVRLFLGGNELTIRRNNCETYNVLIESTETGFRQTFNGSEAEWQKQRNELLGYGEKYMINLPSNNGSVATKDLRIAGTKCKTVALTVRDSLTSEVDRSYESKTEYPRVLLLGGDRCQSIGSMTGASYAYKDLCYLFFDAHWDMRDPNASVYPMVHGSPLFFMLQDQVRKALKEWDESKLPYKHQGTVAHAIEYLESTEEGLAYLNTLRKCNKENRQNGYRGFEWLMDSNKIDPKRIAFVGMRSKIMEAGSSLGGSLPMFFKNLLDLDKQIFTAQDVHTKGVPEVFGECVKVFRNAFSKQHLELKDKEVRAQSGNDKAEWVPPFMVSWDTDSIDPNDFPCTIAQEADGLTCEECLAFSDQIAFTEKMVMMEIIEFNPDLWKGYLDEPIQLTMNDFLAGAYANKLRTPNNVSGQRLDLQKSVKLLHDMIVRASKTSKTMVES